MAILGGPPLDFLAANKPPLTLVSDPLDTLSDAYVWVDASNNGDKIVYDISAARLRLRTAGGNAHVSGALVHPNSFNVKGYDQFCQVRWLSGVANCTAGPAVGLGLNSQFGVGLFDGYVFSALPGVRWDLYRCRAPSGVNIANNLQVPVGGETIRIEITFGSVANRIVCYVDGIVLIDFSDNLATRPPDGIPGIGSIAITNATGSVTFKNLLSNKM